jgi:hypothetical protein
LAGGRQPLGLPNGDFRRRRQNAKPARGDSHRSIAPQRADFGPGHAAGAGGSDFMAVESDKNSALSRFCPDSLDID